MTLDPRWCFFLSLFISILNFLGGASTQFTALGMSKDEIAFLMATIFIVAGILGIINTALSAIPSAAGQTKGFYLGPKDPPKP